MGISKRCLPKGLDKGHTTRRRLCRYMYVPYWTQRRSFNRYCGRRPLLASLIIRTNNKYFLLRPPRPRPTFNCCHTLAITIATPSFLHYNEAFHRRLENSTLVCARSLNTACHTFYHVEEYVLLGIRRIKFLRKN